jgi:hypothetical protein
MKTRNILLALATALAGCYGGYTTTTTTGYVVYQSPPPTRDESIGYRPGYVWVHGHWQYDRNGWNWRPGYYIPERPGYFWVEGHWENQTGQSVWVDGYWRPAQAVIVRRY